MLKIKELRQERNLTQKELAKIIGTSQASVSDWEVMKVEPSIEWLKKIADFFGVTVDFLIDREDDFGNVVIPEKVSERSDEENELLTLYKKLDPTQRAFFMQALRGVANENK